MKNLKKVLIAVLLVLALVPVISCRNQPKQVTDYNVYYTGNSFSDWGTLFDAFWHKMNTNYLFWDLDDPTGTGWDEIYEEYLPKFQALGAIYDSQGNVNTYQMGEARRYLFDIILPLHDGHYALGITLLSATDTTPSVSFALSPNLGRYARNTYDEDGTPFNPTDDEIWAYMTGSDTSSDLYAAINKRRSENPFNIAFYTLTEGANQRDDEGNALFAKSDATNTNSTNITWNPAAEADNRYVFNFESTAENPFRTVTDAEGNVMKFFSFTRTGSDPLYGSLGYVDKGILYFSYSRFSFTSYSTTLVLDEFRRLATSDETEAIIIDFRGNGGGNVDDLTQLWSVFMNDEPMTVGKIRRKAGKNRTDYGPWTDFGIQLNADIAETYDDFDTSKPIVVLTNQGSLSCSEMSTLFFAALREKREYNIRILGENGGGGFGMISPVLAEYLYGSGGLFNFAQISLMYTPFQELVYLDGNSYEGKGFPVDGDPILFEYSDFINGKDAKFDAAMDWLKGGSL